MYLDKSRSGISLFQKSFACISHSACDLSVDLEAEMTEVDHQSRHFSAVLGDNLICSGKGVHNVALAVVSQHTVERCGDAVALHNNVKRLAVLLEIEGADGSFGGVVDLLDFRGRTLGRGARSGI